MGRACKRAAGAKGAGKPRGVHDEEKQKREGGKKK
jgi:hypothetical protein